MYDFFVEIRASTPNVVVEPNQFVLALKSLMNEWLENGNVEMKGIGNMSISVISDVNLDADFSNMHLETFHYAVIGYSWLFGDLTLSSIEHVLTLVNGYTFDITVGGGRQETVHATLSHWYVAPLEPYNTRTQYLCFPSISTHFALPYIHNYGIETLTKFNGCPHLKLAKDAVDIIITDTGYHLPQYNANVTTDDIFEDNTTIYLCIDLFEHIVANISLGPNTTSEPLKQAGQTKYIVSYVLVVVSIVFAFLTFLVYCWLPDLRTQPGINNMLLALLLITCQALFQFGFDTAEYISPTSCAVLGICIHYSWLLLLMWMNVCSIHMFRVFHFDQTKAVRYNRLKTTIKYMVYMISVGSIPILVNISVAMATSGGSDVGYGGLFCYIKSSNITIYILAIPLALIICCNIILFIVVVIQIERSKVQCDTQSDSRHLVSAYAKLSTLTGATWSIGIVFMLTEYEWAEYTFVVLNATQGLFIFIAFVMNKKTFDLLKRRLRCARNVYWEHTKANISPSLDSQKTMVTSSTQ